VDNKFCEICGYAERAIDLVNKMGPAFQCSPREMNLTREAIVTALTGALFAGDHPEINLERGIGRGIPWTTTDEKIATAVLDSWLDRSLVLYAHKTVADNRASGGPTAEQFLELPPDPHAVRFAQLTVNDPGLLEAADFRSS
jgi:hypothetical protein